MPPSGQSTDPWTKIDSDNFAALWDAVLSGDRQATEAALELVRKAVLPMLKASFPCLDAQEVAGSVQRTLLRNLLADASAIKADTLSQFFGHIRARARNKAFKRVKQNRREGELPEVADDSGAIQAFEPADRQKSPAEVAIDNDLIDAFLRKLEERGEPEYSIVMGHIHGQSDVEIAATLGERGHTLTDGAIRMRRLRVMRDIRQLLGGSE